MCYGQMFEDALRTARKRHWCDFCRREIPVGERYHYQSGVTSDGFYRAKSHARCRKVERAATDHWREDDYCEPLDRKQYAQEVARDEGWRSFLGRVRAMFRKTEEHTARDRAGEEKRG